MLGMLRTRQLDAGIPHIELLPSAKLGLALGLENVIHAALISGAAAHPAMKRADRLPRFVGPAEQKEQAL
jgi:hypothetical protein